MQKLNEIIRKLIDLRQAGQAELTLLAVCPNSAAVLEAAVKTAAQNGMPMLFAATLNQVDIDGGYTGWTPAIFVREMRRQAEHYGWAGPLYPCLDHGGPWLKDRHTLDRLSLDETMARVKDSLTACVEAGYALLHIDPTVDRMLPAGEAVPVEMVVARTVELVAHAETVRTRLGLPEISYEVGTEEVHGGLVDESRFAQFLGLLREQLCERGLQAAWPCFVVAQVGTDLHTTFFDAAAARKLHATLAPLGSLAKGHYSDWVENPQEYPAAGMGGANVGPEFTAEEYLALKDLERKELAFLRGRRSLEASNFFGHLQAAVVDSGRWKKWLLPEERGLEFTELRPARQDWLLQTGSRYIWTSPQVVAARTNLYDNLSPILPNPHGYVVDRIGRAIDRYACQFHLFGSLELLGGE